MVTVSDLETRLKTKYNSADDKIRVDDLSGGCGAKFLIAIGSNQFDGVSLLDRQRIVNDLIKDFMADIHAVQLKTWTLKQYDEKINTL
ncbi:hypothetical protein DICPUDRAFT_32760 [Dictyostelium purpureum]|uniref:BolA family protein n=1 Tax=Dictyostelium purpureum TaxID=5786 RepID=F0ZJR4_DICPU|nr:uncharacterized protein DICPUDRAFT_32760 [Dictyostelium purpureum]EGC35827.1 hypothetical protein DICPUDRAFT_32760 [Dictyostelium purpureum]|eukprot:XP_003287664.1 hypothetical protein DICPUDRAFT_32760 [Dictyostelium purpureum]